MNRRQTLGRWGEDLAARFLEQKGYTILERNARTPYGELDLVTHQGELLVFIEVKTRSGRSFGPPESAITPKKRAHLLSAAMAYLQAHPELAWDFRIDVVAILGRSSTQSPEITHFENAIVT